MKINVKSLQNRKVKEIELSEEVFAYPYKEHLIHLAVDAYRAAQRRGTHNAKSRNEVIGSRRKLWRQKGTGRARPGNAQSPLRRGGGVAHGPSPRDYTKKLTPREKRNALRSALSRKLHENGIVVVNRFELESHKTADLAARLEKLGVKGKALVVDRQDNRDLILATRNNPHLKTVDALGVNVYDVVDRNHIVVSEEALGRLVGVLSK